MTVAGLALDTSNQSTIVLLRDPSGRRQVPIWIDNEQAHNIVAGLRQTQTDKPLAHDLMLSLLNAGDLQLEKVIINKIELSTFQAILKVLPKRIICKKPEENSKSFIEIEARPSDAIALAVRAKCSIWMYEQVVVEASIPVDEEADVKDQDEFKQFLDKISPSDLIRHIKRSNQFNENKSQQPESEL